MCTPSAKQTEKTFQLASTNCVGIYGKRNVHEIKTKNENRISAVDLQPGGFSAVEEIFI